MKFAIVSDTHDNMANFNKVITWLNSENIEVMLHCGDICNQSTVDEAVKNFKGQIHFVRGNGDFSAQGGSASGGDLPEKMEIELGGKLIFFNHYPEISKEAAE